MLIFDLFMQNDLRVIDDNNQWVGSQVDRVRDIGRIDIRAQI